MVVQPLNAEGIKAQESLLPLTKVAIHARVDGGFAAVELDLTYRNPADCVFEASYEFPLEKNTVLTKLIATINDKTIEA